MHGVSFEEIRALKQERVRGNKLLSTSADALARGQRWLGNDVKVQDELELVRLHQERRDKVSIGRRWKELEASLLWVVSASFKSAFEQRCQRTPTSLRFFPTPKPAP